MLKLLAPLKSIDHPRGTQYYMYKYYDDMFKKMDAALIYITPSNKEVYQALEKICDGLFLCGGLDMDASYFKQDNHPSNSIEMKSIDDMELELIDLFHQHNKPILGICRGHQVINIAFGGTLIQDIPTQYDTHINHSQESIHGYSHTLCIEKNSTLSKYVEDGVLVNSFHHQAIDKLADGFQVMARSEDGIIEAIEKDNIISIQWHPEKINDATQNDIVNMFQSLFSHQ